MLTHGARRLADAAYEYYESGHYKAAIRTYLQAIDAQGQPNAYLEHKIALAYSGDQNYNKAITHYQKSLDIENDSAIRTILAWTYYRKELCTSAIQEALRALRLPYESYSIGWSAHVSANEVIARCYEEQGNLPEALEHATEALTLAQLNNYSADDIDELTAQVNKLTSLTRQPNPTPDYGIAPTAMLTWESEQGSFWIQYPGGCHNLELQQDGWWSNDLRCTLGVLIRVHIKEWPPSINFASRDTAEWVDEVAADWRDNPDYTRFYRDQTYTKQGRTLELIRYEFKYRDDTPGTSVSGFYIHPDTGALFRVRMHYATETAAQNEPNVDFALKTFTVLR